MQKKIPMYDSLFPFSKTLAHVCTVLHCSYQCYFVLYSNFLGDMNPVLRFLWFVCKMAYILKVWSSAAEGGID